MHIKPGMPAGIKAMHENQHLLTLSLIFLLIHYPYADTNNTSRDDLTPSEYTVHSLNTDSLLYTMVNTVLNTVFKCVNTHICDLGFQQI